MASLVYCKNKNGTTYVYENVSVWNKEKKRADCIRKCIGKLDPATGETIPNTKAEQARPTVVTVGGTAILDRTASDIGLRDVLKKSFPDCWRMIMTAAYFLASEGKALCHSETWSAVHECPSGGAVDNRRMSELLISLTKERQLPFFKAWAGLRADSEYFALDITSVSSYSEMNEYVRLGYNRDKEKLPQINICMALGEKSRMPVCFEVLQGAIKDVTALRGAAETLDFLKAGKLCMVMDKGFYSEANVDAMYAARMRFAVGVPFTTESAKELVESVRDDIESFGNYRRVGEQDLFVSSSLESWKGHRCYVHVYYDAKKAVDDKAAFLRKADQWKRELEGKPVKENAGQYKKYFDVTETPKRGRKVRPREDAIRGHMRSACGFFVLLTNGIKDPVDALLLYRDKDCVEKGFDDLKNALDMKRLRVHSAAAMEGRLFVQFVALALSAGIRNVMEKSELDRKMTLPEMMNEMKSLRRVTLPGKRKPVYTAPSKKQREILDAFGIKTYV
jgi:transposase